jgi:hypothetical protein
MRVAATEELVEAGPLVDDFPSPPSGLAEQHYDGGPEEGTRGPGAVAPHP